MFSWFMFITVFVTGLLFSISYDMRYLCLLIFQRSSLDVLQTVVIWTADENTLPVVSAT